MNVAARRVSNLRYTRHLVRERRCIPEVSRHLSSVVPATNDGTKVPSTLIDLNIAAKIEGQESQVVTVKLREGETLRAESGSMLFMTEGVEMSTDLHGASSAFTRMMTGQNLFLTDFSYTGSGEGMVALGTDFPSKIVRLSLEDYENSSLTCQKGAYMASNPSVDIEMAFTKSFTAGFFGGEGFVLQKLSGQGDVLLKAGGALIERYLEEGESLRVTSGSIVAFTSNVDYDVQMMPGIKNAMFGGEGLFVTKLTGPGKVWLQGMPPDRMISEIARRVPSGGGIGFGVPIGIGGGGGGDAAGAAGGAAGGAAVEAGGGAAVGGATGGMAAAGEAAGTSSAAGLPDSTMASTGQEASAASAVDSESPSALFGDAASADSPSSTESGGDADMFKETTFSDDSTFTDETTFTDDTTFTEGLDSAAEAAMEEGGSTVGSILSGVFDLFSDK